MEPTEAPDQEPSETISTSSPPSKGVGRPSFAKLRRELSDDEFSSPAVQRMLVDEIERLERESFELKDFRSRYFDERTIAAVLNEKLSTHISQEIVHLSCLAAGSAALGYAPNLWSHQPAGWVSIAFGTLLVGAGIAAKVVRK
ncbi:MAG: hypothetical protein Q7T32_06370 [Moraxellaceae bacterium]|nr:hypothetical protein [Moraxellaceae bacterium]